MTQALGTLRGIPARSVTATTAYLFIAFRADLVGGGLVFNRRVTRAVIERIKANATPTRYRLDSHSLGLGIPRTRTRYREGIENIGSTGIRCARRATHTPYVVGGAPHRAGKQNSAI